MTKATPQPPFEFDRYVRGALMAEGVCIERQTTLAGAMQEAARLAEKGPNGEVPVLVYRPSALCLAASDALREALAECQRWHEREDKALSKSGRGDADYYWRRGEHKREIERISVVLAHNSRGEIKSSDGGDLSSLPKVESDPVVTQDYPPSEATTETGAPPMTAPSIREALKPCPFCGSTRLESGGDDKFVGVRCLDCDATGPNHYITGKQWNTRAAILASGLVTVAGENAVTLHQLRSNQFSHPHSDEASIRAALDQAIRSLDEIAAGHIPDCPLHYAGDELAWAQRHVGHLRRKAEIARDAIAAAIRAGRDEG